MAQPNESYQTALYLPSQSACGAGVGGSPPAYGPVRTDLSTNGFLYYVFLPFPTNCTVDLDLRGSSFDTLLEIYWGADQSGTGLTFVGSNDDYYGVASRVSFSAVAGRYYYVVVHGYGGQRGSAYINWTTSPPTYPAPPEPSRFMPDAIASIATGINIIIEPITLPTSTLSLIPPRTRWPLIGAPITAGVRAFQLGGVKYTRVAGTHHWGHYPGLSPYVSRARIRSYSARTQRVGGIRLVRVGPGEFRHWGGIGGTQRIPSFPQFPTPTTWPHSFRPYS